MTCSVKRVVVCLFTGLIIVNALNSDKFNYRESDFQSRDFGPQDWGRVTCDDPKICSGYTDHWETAIEWELSDNNCKWCPADGSTKCGIHHQSPINLERDRAIPRHPNHKQCPDDHWMKFEDSSCTWEMMRDLETFNIERHGLRISQPLEFGNGGSNGVRLACPGSRGRRFGRIDFSHGFAFWWFLSHTEIKVPSEHTQEGKRYSAEVQLAHFFSQPGYLAGWFNEMAHVSIFLDAHEDSPPYAHLDRLICEWRKVEERTRAACGYPSVDPYPGCLNIPREASSFPQPPTRSPTGAPTKSPTKSPTAADDTDPMFIAGQGLPSQDKGGAFSGPCVDNARLSNRCFEFGEEISIEFDNCNARGDDWVGIYDGVTDPNNLGSPVMWMYLCGSQSCDQNTQFGENVFGSNGPSGSGSQEWPLLPGTYMFHMARNGNFPYQSYASSPQFIVLPAGQSCPQPRIRPQPRSIPQPRGGPSNRRLLNRTVFDTFHPMNRNSSRILEMDPVNWRDPDMTEKEWEDFIAEVSKDDVIRERHLLEGAELPWHSYQFLIDVRTEYYFRYGGTQTVPPCHAPYLPTDTYESTNHWRVLKDPIRVHPRQIAEMERLLRERISPRDSNDEKACQYDTAGKVDEDGHISVARPLMATSKGHEKVFCECQRWGSKWPEDKAWCKMKKLKERFYDHPYNFKGEF